MSEFNLPEIHPFHLKTLMALDFGEKFIGIATFCVNRDPFPLGHGRIQNLGENHVLQELNKIIEQESIDSVIVGVPRLLDGKKTKSSQRAEDFRHFLEKNLKLLVYEQDETLSTYEAEDRMKNSPRYNFKVDLRKIDELSACIILEDFIHRIKTSPDL
jgi:putative holliday junction resolvase